MKGRIAFFSLLLGLVLIGLGSYAVLPAPLRNTIYNSGPRGDCVPGIWH